jgi:hypothetical protein
LPINIKQPRGHPVVVTESGWNLPHKYQAEGPFLVAAYMSLSGVDAFYWFNPTTSGYDPNPYFYWTTLTGGQHPLSRWSVSIPGQMAMFPANALIYRLGYISESKTMVSENRSLSSIYQRNVPVISEEMGFDPNRDTYEPVLGQTELNPVSYLTGKIEVKYNTPQDGKLIDPSMLSLINLSGKTVASSTGELKWDYKKGICTINSPFTQGICGFVGQTGVFQLKDVTITTQNDYATVNVVSMDKIPLSTSARILVQVGTVYQPSQWAETSTIFDNKGVKTNGFRIDNTGKMPWKAAKTKVSITLKNKVINSATLLDAAGYSIGKAPVIRNGDNISYTLPENAMYIVLTSEISTGMAEVNSQSKMKVYPNPSNGKFYIDVPNANLKSYSIDVFNILGIKVFEKYLANTLIEIDLKHCSKGTYFAILREGETRMEVQKLIFQN